MDEAEPSPSRGLPEFLTWLDINKVKILIVAGAVALVVTITAVYLHQESQREIRASEALSEIRTPMNQVASLPPETIQAYLDITAKHPRSKAAARAVLRVAGSYFVEGKYAEAQAMFERFLKDYPGSEWTDQAALGVASSLDAQNQLDQAITKYEDVRSRHANTAVADEATLGLARIYQAQGKNEEAIKLYHSLSEGSQSSIGTRAGMRKEEMLKLNPALSNAIAPILTAETTPVIPPPTITLNSNAAAVNVVPGATATVGTASSAPVVISTTPVTPQATPAPAPPATETPAPPKEAAPPPKEPPLLPHRNPSRPTRLPTSQLNLKILLRPSRPTRLLTSRLNLKIPRHLSPPNPNKRRLSRKHPRNKSSCRQNEVVRTKQAEQGGLPLKGILAD